MGQPIKVFICDDHVLFRSGVKAALSTKPDIQIVGEAQDGSDLLYKLRHSKPDVILLDINMPIMDGMAVLPILKSDENFKSIKVIILSMHNQTSMVSKMMSLGANSYLTKSDDVELIYDAIVSCHKNEFYFNDLTNKALLKTVVKNQHIFEEDEELNEIEEKRKEKINSTETSYKFNILGSVLRGGISGIVFAVVLLIAYLVYLFIKNMSTNVSTLNNFTPQ